MVSGSTCEVESLLHPVTMMYVNVHVEDTRVVPVTFVTMNSILFWIGPSKTTKFYFGLFVQRCSYGIGLPQ